MNVSNFTKEELIILRNGCSLKLDSHLRALKNTDEEELKSFNRRKIDECQALIARLNKEGGL